MRKDNVERNILMSLTNFKYRYQNDFYNLSEYQLTESFNNMKKITD